MILRTKILGVTEKYNNIKQVFLKLYNVKALLEIA